MPSPAIIQKTFKAPMLYSIQKFFKFIIPKFYGAGYTVSPELKAYQDRLQALTGGALTQAEMAGQQYAPLQQGAQGLFGLGQQYLQQSPQQVAAQYIQQQQDLH